jgi:UDP-N-acetylmuramoyl-L-alanyl-D-glutamate--2,6-diaminopimelate ligase
MVIAMRLSQLLLNVSYSLLDDETGVEIGGVTADSRQVRPGYAFVAIRGTTVDGHRYLQAALDGGARALVVAEDVEFHLESEQPFALVEVKDTREALAWMTAALHGYPARLLRVVGVTGTDGKTTTVNLISSILRAGGHSVGMISTVSAQIGDDCLDTGLHTTTPDAPDLQGYLARMVASGLEYAVLEATSHGLAQHRVTGCEQDAAVVTNITHEHLDYHRTYEAYFAAKARLFRGLSTAYRKPGVPKVAVLNRDDASFDSLWPIPADIKLTYGLSSGVDVWAGRIDCAADYTAFQVITPQGYFDVRTPLVGVFNVYNILAATAAGLSQGVALDHIRQGLEAVRGVVGRMERIERGQDFTVVVDFAHTPNGLRRALETARTMTRGAVIVVFGSAGLRDVAKRGLMGHEAGRLADRIVITAEDPRTESLDDIMTAIAEGCEAEGKREGESYWRVADRAAAIQFAIDLARPGDLVLTAGKAHEKSMCFGTTEYPWSEHEAVEKALSRRLARER